MVGGAVRDKDEAVPAYRELERRFERLMTLQSVEYMLHWDTAAVMPEAASESRAGQLALVRVLQHEMLSADAVPGLLDEAEGEAGALDPWDAANLREMRRMWIHAASVPVDLVDALSRACSACHALWRGARPNSDFDGIRPALEEVLARTREVAQARGERLGCSAYDALLDQHEPGMRCAHIDPLFDELAAFLPGFREKVIAYQGTIAAPLPLKGPFAVDAQRELGLSLMKVVGFDFAHGRLDVSLHPFCGGTPDDVRITTRYREDDFAESLMGVLHETGHAMYQRGLPKKWRVQPVGQPRGMAVHESQSLLLEMQACRSKPFLEFAAPLIRKAFGGDGDAWQADNLYRRYTHVKPGFIRVSADEVCYPSHVILRYRLEKAMVAGELEVSDLPQAWREGMLDLLGLDPPDHANGCLQDVHWFDGAFGYFPSYTLGAMTAAQLFRTAVGEDGDIVAGIAKGDFAPLFSWLRSKIHELGSRHTTPELVERATGRSLDIEQYKLHLSERYLPEG
jgi:carboxypeptidase Taq